MMQQGSVTSVDEISTNLVPEIKVKSLVRHHNLYALVESGTVNM